MRRHEATNRGRRGRALAALAALLLAFAWAPGCGGKFVLPVETPGGVIPEKGSYAYQGSLRGLPNLTDVLLTLGTGSTLYAVYDYKVQAYPRFFRAGGSTPPLSYQFSGMYQPVKICQGPNRVYVLEHGDTTLAKTDSTYAPGFYWFGLTGGSPQRTLRDTSLASVRGIASDSQGNVYLSCVAREFIRDDPQDSRKRTFKFVSRVYRYLAARDFAKDAAFYVDDGQGVGTISEPGDCFVVPIGPPTYLYVADTGKDQVQRLTIQDNNGEPLPGLALDGGLTGTTFIMPPDVVADADGFMYIVDQGNRRVVRYGPAGDYIQKVNIELDLDSDSLHVPIAASADDSLVYVADRETGKISSYKRRK